MIFRLLLQVTALRNRLMTLEAEFSLSPYNQIPFLLCYYIIIILSSCFTC